MPYSAPAFYFPPIHFWLQGLPHPSWHLATSQRYQKQTYFNRCTIAGPQGAQHLVVPVRHTGSAKSLLECRIDYSKKWVSEHQNALQTAYGKAPFFEHYAPGLFALLQARPSHLVALNYQGLTHCLALLKMDISIAPAVREESTGEEAQLIFQSLDNKTDSQEAPNQSPIVHYQRTTAVQIPFIPYRQVFGRDFEKDLSILDLLFCLGPQARTLLKQQLSIPPIV